VVPPAQLQAATQVRAGAAAGQPPTYGALLRDATDLVAEARRLAIGPFDDAQRAADAVVDLERCLAIGGHHLRLLLAPAAATPSPLSGTHREFVRRLAELRMERRGGNAWASAGDGLGVAHDVLATHVGPRGELRTPEARTVVNPAVQVAATTRVIGLLAEPLAVTRDLLTAARQAQPRQAPPLTRSMSAHLRQAIAAIQRTLEKAPPLGLPPPGDLGELDGLTPALTKLAADSRPDQLSSRITALRVLRQVSYRQSQGLEPANAHTLQELCTLGAATCRAAEGLLPLASTPLGRVRRAAAADELRRAAALWGELGADLYPRIQELAKAPAIYRDAVRLVTQGAEGDHSSTLAVLAALPGLAAQAAATVRTLQDRRELVIRRQEAGQLSPRWHSLDAAASEDLARAFAAAGRATRLAVDAVRSEPDASGHDGQSAHHLDGPARWRERGLSR
jgi:hypothetical protein